MIKVHGVGTDSEKNNEFYNQYKLFCEEWESFIKSKSGNLRSKFSVWALILKAEYSKGLNCTLEIEKASIESGNLFVSSNVRRSVITVSDLNLSRLNCNIKQSKLKYRLLSYFNESEYLLAGNYVLIANNKISVNFTKELRDFVHELNQLEGVISFDLNTINGVLKLRTNNLFKNFEFLNRIEVLNFQ